MSKSRYAHTKKADKKTIKATVKETVKRQINKNLEFKYIQATGSAGNALNGSAPVSICLNQIANDGSGDVTHRSGLSVNGKSLDIRAVLNKHASSVGDAIRVLLVKDTQQIADTAPTYADVMNGNSTIQYQSGVKELIKKRYRILYDRTITFDSSQGVKFLHIYKNLQDRKIYFNGDATTDYDRGSIYLMAVTFDNTNKMIWNLQTLLKWTDA